MLTLEGAQAGLSWSTILHKREGYRSAFAGFDIKKVAKMSEARQKALVCNSGIVRHAGKIKSVILNAKAALQVQKEEGSLSTFLWSFVGGLPQNTRRQSSGDIPSKTMESEIMSKALKKRGFKFVGPTICYAFMQATGMVNDHPVHSPQWEKVHSLSGKKNTKGQ